jgi:outer membrane protein assembly factor BamB
MRRGWVVAVCAVLAVSACSGGRPPASPASSASASTTDSPTASRTSSASAPAPEWPTYHGSNDRAGQSTAAPLRIPLHIKWRLHLDAAMYAEPIVAAGLAIAATENNTVYAVGLATGKQRWRRHLTSPARLSNLPCGNIDPSGITGTPAYDDGTGLVFVVTESSSARHELDAIDALTGRVRWHRDIDVLSHRDRYAEQQRAALLVVDGHVYVAFGGRAGDCGNYVGYIVSVPTTGRGTIASYAVPTAREAGMWAAAGPVVGPDGDIYVASGNGAEVGGQYDGSDSVIRLSTSLHRVAFFTPSTWRQDNAEDLDLGSMSPVPVAGDLVIAGKRGEVFLLRPSLGGIGGQIQSLSGCAGYGGAATAGSRVILPCDGGIRALDVVGGRMHWAWSNHRALGSPVASAGTVYALDRDKGDLVELALANGHVRGSIHVGSTTRFATPTPVDGVVLVGTTSQLVAVS